MNDTQINEEMEMPGDPLENADNGPVSGGNGSDMERSRSSRSNAYAHAIELLKYEGEMLWVILSACMVVNVLLVGFIANIVSDKDYVYSEGSLPCEISALAGIILSIAWYGTFLRNSQYYHFRMEQAKFYEDMDFCLLNREGEDFAEGKRVMLNGRPHRLTSLASAMKNKLAGHILIWLFFVIYVIISFHCWPYGKKKEIVTKQKVELNIS